MEGNIYTGQLAAGSQTDRLWLVDAAGRQVYGGRVRKIGGEGHDCRIAIT